MFFLPTFSALLKHSTEITNFPFQTLSIILKEMLTSPCICYVGLAKVWTDFIFQAFICSSNYNGWKDHFCRVWEFCHKQTWQILLNLFFPTATQSRETYMYTCICIRIIWSHARRAFFGVKFRTFFQCWLAFMVTCVK